MSAGDKHDSDSADESEFGLGLGMIDPIRRANRALEPHQEMWELYSRPKTFDGSMEGRPDVETTPVPSLMPGETEADR